MLLERDRRERTGERPGPVSDFFALGLGGGSANPAGVCPKLTFHQVD